MKFDFVHFFTEVLDFPFNLNIHGINTDNISITGPPRLFINGMLFPSGIKLVKIRFISKLELIILLNIAFSYNTTKNRKLRHFYIKKNFIILN